MHRLLAIAKYDERYVIPTAYAAEGHRLEESATDCALSYEGGPGMYESGPFGEASGVPVPVAVETFHALAQRRRQGGGAQRPQRRILRHAEPKWPEARHRAGGRHQACHGHAQCRRATGQQQAAAGFRPG